MEELSSSPDFRASTQEAIKNFLRMLASWEKKLSSPATLINTIVKDTGYEAMVREEFPDSDKAVAFKMRGIEFLSDRLQRFIKENPEQGLRDYLRSVSILGMTKAL